MFNSGWRRLINNSAKEACEKRDPDTRWQTAACRQLLGAGARNAGLMESSLATPPLYQGGESPSLTLRSSRCVPRPWLATRHPISPQLPWSCNHQPWPWRGSSNKSVCVCVCVCCQDFWHDFDFLIYFASSIFSLFHVRSSACPSFVFYHLVRFFFPVPPLVYGPF